MATEDTNKTAPKVLDAKEIAAAKKKKIAAAKKKKAAMLAAVKPVAITAVKPKTVAQPSAEMVATAARFRRRHWNIILSFFLFVITPVLITGWYLWERSVEQYASTVSFSVRSSSPPASGSEIFSQISLISGTNSTDTDILYQFIQSQEMVSRLDDRLGLRAMYSRYYDDDMVFSFNPDGTLEDLVSYWRRMVHIGYDRSTGLMNLRVLAFDAIEAQTIAKAISEESTKRINELSGIARADATRYAITELKRASEELREKRKAVTTFRLKNQTTDPTKNIQGQMVLINILNEQLAASIIDLKVMMNSSQKESDPRIKQMNLRIQVIREQIKEELSRFGNSEKDNSTDYAHLVGEFERLNADLEFAELVYRSALLSYNSAQADAAHTLRYLAEHIKPTLASSSRYPQRILIMLGISLVLILVWAVSILVYYSIRDRR